MKIEGRVELHMTKKICGGKIIDSFTSVVASKHADQANKMYEQMGYKVTRI